MNLKIGLSILSFIALVNLAATASRGQQSLGDPTRQLLDWCDLARTPKKFAGKQIRLKAVLVENHNPYIIDGADPQLYSVQCLDVRFTTTIRWLGFSYNLNKAHNELDRARKMQDKFFVSRATVILVGTFNGAHKHKYRGWADSEFVIRDVEGVEPVPQDAPWPKWMHELFKNTSRHNKSLDRSAEVSGFRRLVD